MSAIGDVIKSVLLEHIWTPRKKGPAECWSGCEEVESCGLTFTVGSEYRRHIAEAICERLGVQERVEWGLRYGDGIVEPFRGASADEKSVQQVIRRLRTEYSATTLASDYEPMTVVSRTVTTFEHVGEWETVE